MSATEEIKIKKVHTFLDLAIASIVFAAGVGIYFLLPGWGILFCLIGVLLFVFYKRAYKRVGASTLLKEKSLDISHECMNGIIDFLGGAAGNLELTAALDGDHLYLETYFNANAQQAYVQLYEVKENSFIPITDMVELKGTKAQTLITKL